MWRISLWLVCPIVLFSHLVSAAAFDILVGTDYNPGTGSTAVMPGGLFSAAAFLVTAGVNTSNSSVVEYLNTADFPDSPGGHFFYSSDPAEQAAVDAGAAGAFLRTGHQFLTGGAIPVCRFYGSVTPGPNSHFFTVDINECNALKAAQVTPRPTTVQQWNYEGVDYNATPATTGGDGERSCPANTQPLYRAYNNAYPLNGPKNPWDSNHRFTPQFSDIADMIAKGWRDEGIAFCTPTPPVGSIFGLEWPGDGAVRRMLYWHNPFPIYDATYVFRVFPRKKNVPPNPNGYYTTFFWGNDGNFWWDSGSPNSYYGAHPYPIPAPNGPGQWEISVEGGDFVTGSEVVWDRWYTQAFVAWRESPSITHHEFYWDLPDTTKVIRRTIVGSNWGARNPPTPAIVIGQAPDLNGASWGGYPGWEEFNGIIRGIQMYAGKLELNDILSEITTPQSTVAGSNLIWYLNLNPRPSDVTDKKGTGTAHNPSWSGTTALEWVW